MLDFNDKRLAPPNDKEPIVGQVYVPRLAIMGTNEDGTLARRLTTALYGETVAMYSHNNEFAQIRLTADHYVGWAQMKSIGEVDAAPTHRLCVPMSYAFLNADIKSAPKTTLFLNSLVTAGEREGNLVHCDKVGWLPEVHLAPLGQYDDDPAEVALGFFGAPYLWGGSDVFGADCSGLVQSAFKACGLQLPRDSDMLFAWAGQHIENWDAPGALQRNDLVFWKGHVGIMLSPDTILHANGNHMATRYEPLEEAVKRIAESYGEPIGAKRIALDGSDTVDWLNG